MALSVVDRVPALQRKRARLPHWLFLPALEHTRVRFVQDDSDSGSAPWLLVGSEEDWELSARIDGGPLLVGAEINVGPLRELGADRELRELVNGTFRMADRAAKESRIHELLALCPRRRFIPMIDLDVAESATTEEALAWARALDPVIRERGLGTPTWHLSGGRGVHGDIVAPDNFEHCDLLEIARVIVVDVAREVGIPLLSEHPSKEGRPPVVIDDRLFRRNPEGRGALWRPSGATKPKTGARKVPVDIWTGELAEYVAPVPGELDAYQAAAAIVARERELQGSSYGRARRGPRRLRVPVELPAGTTVLENFSRVLARVLEGRTGANHEARVASAGWLLGLGVSVQIVENSLARATRNADDARDAALSTSRRIDAGLPAKGLPALQELLGGASVVELREALVRDGIAKARKTYLTDVDRRFMMRVYRALPDDHPGRKAVLAGARCGTFSLPYECPDHGPQGVRLNVSERELTCPHCREARISARIEVMRETWKAERLGVLIVKPVAGESDPIRALTLARGRAKGLLFRPWRWVIGHDHVLFVFEAFDADGVAINRQDDAAKLGVECENPMIVSKAEALELVARAWRSPGVAFQGLVESEDLEGVLAFPWLARRNVMRTGADKGGKLNYPWATATMIRERAKLRAIAARGGVDPNVCDEAIDYDSEWGRPIPCGKPYHIHVDHLPTGTRLTPVPIVGRFPNNRELGLLLDYEDPEVLRAGYEQRRSFARRL